MEITIILWMFITVAATAFYFWTSRVPKNTYDNLSVTSDYTPKEGYIWHRRQ